MSNARKINTLNNQIPPITVSAKPVLFGFTMGSFSFSIIVITFDFEFLKSRLFTYIFKDLSNTLHFLIKDDQPMKVEINCI